MSMFNDIIRGSEDNERECNANADFVSIYARRFPPGRWSFSGPGSEKKWYSTYDSRQQGEWARVAELMVVKFGESGHPVFRATSPFSRGVLKSKGGGKLSIDFWADGRTIETVFHSTSWQKTLRNSHNLQNQWHVVSTLCQETKVHLNQKVGSEGTPRLGPYWKSQPATFKVNYRVEIRIESVNKVNSHSWVRISHGLNKLVTDLIDHEYDDNEQETSETKSEEFALKTDVLASASRSKAKAKPRRRTSA